MVPVGSLVFDEQAEERLQIDRRHIDAIASQSGQHITRAAYLNTPDQIGGFLPYDLFDLPADCPWHPENDRHGHRVRLVFLLKPFEDESGDLHLVFFGSE